LPQETFLKAIAGDLVEVTVMIPPGNSPANYQPTPKQMVDFNDSQVYFHIDVAAEVNIMNSISNGSMILVDLADVSDAAYPARYFDEDSYLNTEAEDSGHDDEDESLEHDHSHEGRDPHIWLSPRRVIVMVEEMIKVLSEIDPTNKEIYESNGQDYINKLQALDSSIENSFSEFKNPTFLMYHPSYGYFADDYGLDMIAIESEGKAATIKGLDQVIDYALKNNIKAIFYQEEFDSNQAEIVAKEINGVTIKVTPLSKDYIESLKEMVEKLKDILN
jgi:zinc transport system substrate-binding protein